MAKEINTNTKATIKKMEEKITTPRTGLEGLEDDQRILNRFVSTIEHCVRRGVIKAKDELIRIRLGAEEYADADNNTVYLPKEVLDMRNSQVYWKIFQNVGKILLKKGKIQPLVSIDAFQVTEKLILDTAEEYAAVKAQCAIDMFAYGCQAYNQSPEFYVPDVTDKDIRKTSIFESAEELEFAVEKENSIRSIRRKAMAKAAQDSDMKAKSKTVKTTLDALKDKKEDLMSKKLKKETNIKIQIPESTTSDCVDPKNLDESVISRFIKMNHLREVGGNFYTKIDFLLDTFLNEKRKNFKDTKKVKKKVTKTFKKEEPAVDEAGNPILTADGKQEMVTKTYTDEVDDEVSVKIESSEITRILCEYKDYFKFIETEYNLMNKEILISKSRPHRRLIINTFKYMNYNPGKIFNRFVEDQIRGASIDRDVEFSVKAGIRVNKCRSYNDKLAAERERRYHIFKSLPEGAMAKNVDYKKLNENPEALAAFEEYLSVLPVEKTVDLDMYPIPADIKTDRTRDTYNAIKDLKKSNSI